MFPRLRRQGRRDSHRIRRAKVKMRARGDGFRQVQTVIFDNNTLFIK